MTLHLYPEGITSVGRPCWCGAQFLAATVSSLEVDGTIHARGWCESLRAVSSPGMASPGASPANPPSGS